MYFQFSSFSSPILLRNAILESHCCCASILLRSSILESHFPNTPHGAPFIWFILLLNIRIQTRRSIAQMCLFPMRKTEKYRYRGVSHTRFSSGQISHFQFSLRKYHSQIFLPCIFAHLLWVIFSITLKLIWSWGRRSMAVAGEVTWHGRAHPYSWSITIVSLRSKESEEWTTEASGNRTPEACSSSSRVSTRQARASPVPPWY
jgi:hypothetical protein